MAKSLTGTGSAERTVILLDENRSNPTEVILSWRNFGRRIIVDGRRYDHCGENADGVWLFEPMK